MDYSFKSLEKEFIKKVKCKNGSGGCVYVYKKPGWENGVVVGGISSSGTEWSIDIRYLTDPNFRVRQGFKVKN